MQKILLVEKLDFLRKSIKCLPYQVSRAQLNWLEYRLAMAAVVGSSPIARSSLKNNSPRKWGIFFSKIESEWDENRASKCQLNLAFLAREPARGGEHGVPPVAPEKSKIPPITRGDFQFRFSFFYTLHILQDSSEYILLLLILITRALFGETSLLAPSMFSL